MHLKSKYKVRVIDVTYQKGKDGCWPARIYLPENQGPFPALLDVHGGAWTKGGHTDNEIIDLSLAASGLVVFAIEWFPDMPHGFACQAGTETDNALDVMKNFIRRQLSGDKKAYQSRCLS